MILSKYFKCLRNGKKCNYLNGLRNKSTITSSGTVKSVLSDVDISENMLPDFVWEKTKQFHDLVALVRFNELILTCFTSYTRPKLVVEVKPNCA